MIDIILQIATVTMLLAGGIAIFVLLKKNKDLANSAKYQGELATKCGEALQETRKELSELTGNVGKYIAKYENNKTLRFAALGPKMIKQYLISGGNFTTEEWVALVRRHHCLINTALGFCHGEAQADIIMAVPLIWEKVDYERFESTQTLAEAAILRLDNECPEAAEYIRDRVIIPVKD